MQRKTIFLFLLFLFFRSNSLFAQKQDSATVSTITKNFFDWYTDAIKHHNSDEYGPTFMENSNKMTTLDFSKYEKNLRKYGFSDSLIQQEKQSYQTCITNLAKIKYRDFKNKIKDLDDYEEINCDFNNQYRWIGGQEMKDGYTISEVKIEKNKAIVIGYLYLMAAKDENGKLYTNDTNVILVKQNGLWKILEIKY